MEDEIDLKELFSIFWSKKLQIFMIIVLFVALGIFYTMYLVKPDYKSSTTLVLTKNTTDNETITQSEVNLNQKLVATYTTLIKSDNVLRQVIHNLGLNIDEEDLRKSVSVSLVNGTQLIEVCVTNEIPENARIYASEITKVFIKKVKDIYKIDNISLIDEAKIESTPYNVNHVKDIVVFTFIGLVVAFVYIFIENLLDTTVKTVDEAEKRLNLNVLASIPNYDYKIKRKGKK